MCLEACVLESADDDHILCDEFIPGDCNCIGVDWLCWWLYHWCRSWCCSLYWWSYLSSVPWLMRSGLASTVSSTGTSALPVNYFTQLLFSARSVVISEYVVSGGCYALSTPHRTGSALQKFVKTCNQSLKHKVNRWVLSLRLNECKLSASRTAAGRVFHTTGLATEKALSPNFVLVRGTV